MTLMLVMMGMFIDDVKVMVKGNIPLMRMMIHSIYMAPYFSLKTFKAKGPPTKSVNSHLLK